MLHRRRGFGTSWVRDFSREVGSLGGPPEPVLAFAHPLAIEQSELMQVGGQDRQADRSFEALRAMRPHPVQPVRSQRVNCRFDRRMLAAGPCGSGVRLACPLVPGQATLLRHRHGVEQFTETLAFIRAV